MRRRGSSAPGSCVQAERQRDSAQPQSMTAHGVAIVRLCAVIDRAYSSRYVTMLRRRSFISYGRPELTEGVPWGLHKPYTNIHAAAPTQLTPSLLYAFMLT
jgi:hypothetical protein